VASAGNTKSVVKSTQTGPRKTPINSQTQLEDSHFSCWTILQTSESWLVHGKPWRVQLALLSHLRGSDM